MDELPVEPERDTEVRFAQLRRDPRDSVEYGLGIVGRATDDSEDLTGRSLIFESLLKLALARLLRLEQPRVLDGDDGLVGEGLKQVNLSVGERASLDAADSKHADSRVGTDQRDVQHGAETVA